MTCECEVATCAKECVVNLTGYYSPGGGYLTIIDGCKEVLWYSEGMRMFSFSAGFVGGFLVTALAVLVIIALFGGDKK